MKKHISFPSIEQFRHVVATVNRQFNFVGLDEQGEPIYDHNKDKPTLKFKGTVKLHGTNAGICYNNEGGLWAQSRENIITPESDNAGFAFFVESNREIFEAMFFHIAERDGIDVNTNTISIYGEWCGGNIQKGVGITNLPKSFFIFGVKVSPFPIEGAEKQPAAYWINYHGLKAPDAKIYNIDDFQTWEMDIDFNSPELSQNKLSELTIAVEDECPVAKAFGFSGIGEGIVWSCEFKGVVHRFKVKGELHAGKSKVKTLSKIDDAKINKAREIADKVTPTWRLAQMIEKSCNLANGGELDRAKLGTYLKMVMDDVLKEDLDILVEAGLEPKDVSKYVSEIARKYFFEQEKV
jgi:hypothetical protein